MGASFGPGQLAAAAVLWWKVERPEDGLREGIAREEGRHAGFEARVSEGRVSEGRVSEGRVSEGRAAEGRVSEDEALLR